MDAPKPIMDYSTSPATNPVSPLKNRISLKSILAYILGLIIIAGLSVFAYQQHDKYKKSNVQVSDLNKQISTFNGEKAKLTAEIEKRKNTTGEANIDKANFQSVFLKSGQVYFGKITKITETQVTLTNIYYLSNSKASTTSTPSGDVSLVKLGNELHGPQDTMYIERKEMDFWENLKSDGEVAKAIAVYEKQNKK